MAAELGSLVERLEKVTTRLEAVAVGGSQPGSDDGKSLAPFVVAFDGILSGPFKDYTDLSNKIGGDVQTQAQIVKDAFTAQRGYLVLASQCKQPAQDIAVKLLEPTSSKLQAIEEYVAKNRRSDFFNHLSGVGASIPALGWVTVSPTPGPFVKDMSDSGQFYLNRVLKDFKEKDKVHADWVKAWLATLSQLGTYIKECHTTGLAWNPKGKEASAVAKSVPPPPPPAAGGPPPPPPPPGPIPSDLFEDAKKPKGEGNTAARNALFAEISQGTDITKGLKKVADDQKTHKNPNLRLQTPRPYKPTPSPKPGQAFGTKKVESVRPPKCALEGKKWLVEYQHGNKNVVISDTNIKQTVYIFKCDNSTIQVKGKINSITLDGCKKTAVVFDDVIASFDVINCQSIQAQVTGKIPIISIDKTDGCMIYLSKDSVNAEIVSAKSSEMNILVPQESGDFKEFALPEQYKSVFDGDKFVTTPTDIVG